MSERKVLNKYYPPDFDPTKIPRIKRPKNRQITVRTMAPFNMRCKTCGDYIAQGTKFNARKETVEGEDYMGLAIYRLYIKCPRCMSEITFKTDLKNQDYVVENGATQNHAALKLAERQAEEEACAEAEEEKINPMKHLENRTKASKQEMEAFQQLQLLKSRNQRERVVDFDSMISDVQREAIDSQLEEEELLRMEARAILATGQKLSDKKPCTIKSEPYPTRLEIRSSHKFDMKPSLHKDSLKSLNLPIKLKNASKSAPSSSQGSTSTMNSTAPSTSQTDSASVGHHQTLCQVTTKETTANEQHDPVKPQTSLALIRNYYSDSDDD